MLRAVPRKAVGKQLPRRLLLHRRGEGERRRIEATVIDGNVGALDRVLCASIHEVVYADVSVRTCP